MDNREDVVVIGGGVIGICAAYFLQKVGCQVTVLERGEVCSACSFGNAGWIVPSHSVPLAKPGVIGRALRWMFDPESPFYVKPRLDVDLISWLWYFRSATSEKAMRKTIEVARDLSTASLRLYEELVADERLECRFEQKGLLVLYKTPQGYDEGAEEAQLLADYDISGRLLSPGDVRELEPSVSEDVIGGIHYQGDAHLMPSEFVMGLADVCRRMGVKILTDTEVLGFEVADGKISIVRTSQGEHQPTRVVLAAGSWSPGLVSDLRLPIQPAKGYSVTFERPERIPRLPVQLGEAKLGVTPMGSMLRLAGTLELSGLNLDIASRRVEAIRRAADEYLNLDLDTDGGTVWCGMRPLTPDGLPIIGQAPSLSNLIIATGHSMTGVTLGPITGCLVAQLISGTSPTVDPVPLSPIRFN